MHLTVTKGCYDIVFLFILGYKKGWCYFCSSRWKEYTHVVCTISINKIGKLKD